MDSERERARGKKKRERERGGCREGDKTWGALFIDWRSDPRSATQRGLAVTRDPRTESL